MSDQGGWVNHKQMYNLECICKRQGYGKVSDSSTVLGTSNPAKEKGPSGTKGDFRGLPFDANRAACLRRSWPIVFVILGSPQLKEFWLHKGSHFDIWPSAQGPDGGRRPRTCVGQRLAPTNEDGNLPPSPHPPPT